MKFEPAKILETLNKSCADGLVVSELINGSPQIVSCSPALARLIGGSLEEIVGQPLAEFIDLTGRADAATGNGGEAHCAQSGRERVSQDSDDSAALSGGLKPATIICRTGLDLHMPASHSPILSDKGEIIGYLTVVHIVQANSVQQAQTEFVSTVSHELRTPLTSIKGFADTILRAGDRLDAQQTKRYIGIIKEQADRLTRLVEDLLAVSRLESRKMQMTIRAVDLEQAVERVCQNLADKAERHKILTKIPPALPKVWADADRLEQILTNLVDNAIKYSPTGTTVTICARTIEAAPKAEMVEFSVNDQGGGIDADHLPQIFSKFGRLDNPLTRQTEGTGLGLYITKSLVLALDGQISVSSDEGSTTFTVQLPAASLEAQAARGLG